MFDRYLRGFAGHVAHPGSLHSRAGVQAPISYQLSAISLLKVRGQKTWGLRSVARQQVFVDPFRARGNQTAILIVTEQDDPIEDGIGPFTTPQEAFRVCSERAKEIRDVGVMPGDENPFSLLRRTQGSRQFSRPIAAKMRIDSQIRGLRERLDRQTGALALL
jgi:hypothetical protein